MRPDDRPSAFDDLAEPGVDLPFDADLESLHEELAAAGQHARRVLSGRTQPTRLFSNQLRAHLLGAAAGASGGATSGLTITTSAATSMEPASVRVDRPIGESATSLREHAPVEAGQRGPRLPFTLAPRTLLALLAIASMAGVLVLGALGGTFGPPLP